MITTDARFGGIDVAKDHPDSAVQPGGEQRRATHDAAGLADMVSRPDAPAPTPVVLEASGGDERTVMAALSAAGLPVAVVTPPGSAGAGQRDRRVRTAFRAHPC